MICLGKFSKRAVCLKLWLYLLIFVSLIILQSSGGDDEPMSDNEMSRDGDSPDALSRVPPTDIDPETLEKLKQQVSTYVSIILLVFSFQKLVRFDLRHQHSSYRSTIFRTLLLFTTKKFDHWTLEREEREEIGNEFGAQRAGLDMSNLSPKGSNK